MLIVEHGEHYRVADYRPTNWESFKKTGSILSRDLSRALADLTITSYTGFAIKR
jgi:hypothetical protein